MYRSLPVDPALRPFVLAIRVQEVARVAHDAGTYTVLPGPFPVMGFRLEGELRAVRGTGADLLAPSGVTGLQDQPRRYLPGPGTRSVLVTLRPEGAYGLLGAGMDGLVNGEVALDRLLPAAAVREAGDRIAEAAGPGAVGEAIGSLLRAAAGRSRTPVHPVVAAAVTRILATRGNARIEALARSVAVGRRHLERLFRAHVGVPPKRLSALARFAWAAAHLRDAPSWSELALRAGYADQAHLIRAFTELAGASPARLLASADGSEMSHSFNPWGARRR